MQLSPKNKFVDNLLEKIHRICLCIAPASNPNIRFKLTQGVIYMLFSLQALLQFIAKGDSEQIHLSSAGS
jgi:hypothetical protein